MVFTFERSTATRARTDYNPVTQYLDFSLLAPVNKFTFIDPSWGINSMVPTWALTRQGVRERALLWQLPQILGFTWFSGTFLNPTSEIVPIYYYMLLNVLLNVLLNEYIIICYLCDWILQESYIKCGIFETYPAHPIMRPAEFILWK